MFRNIVNFFGFVFLFKSSFIVHGSIVGMSTLDEKPTQIETCAGTNMLKWPNGRVPYVLFHRERTLSWEAMLKVNDAITEFHSKTCIRFVPYYPPTYQENYLTFLDCGDGQCWSYIGMKGGNQPISLNDKCVTSEVTRHEMMHALGFYHEQQRPDRDLYVTIYEENIDPKHRPQYEKVNWLNAIDVASLKYDYDSVMHHSSSYGAIDGKFAMEPINNTTDLVGMENSTGTLSDCDVAKINFLYNCNENYRKTC